MQPPKDPASEPGAGRPREAVEPKSERSTRDAMISNEAGKFKDLKVGAGARWFWACWCARQR